MPKTPRRAPPRGAARRGRRPTPPPRRARRRRASSASLVGGDANLWASADAPSRTRGARTAAALLRKTIARRKSRVPVHKFAQGLEVELVPFRPHGAGAFVHARGARESSLDSRAARQLGGISRAERCYTHPRPYRLGHALEVHAAARRRSPHRLDAAGAPLLLLHPAIPAALRPYPRIAVTRLARCVPSHYVALLLAAF